MSHNTQPKPPVYRQNRAAASPDLVILYPTKQFGDHLTPEGPAICTRCHSYLETDHWLYNERRYRELEQQPDISRMLCPGCERVERRLYEGEVTIRHDWEAVTKDDLVHLVHNEEARVRATNPSARIALMEDRGDEIYILTTTQFLAERIGKELHKAYHGDLTLSHLPRERFTRVMWARD